MISDLVDGANDTDNYKELAALGNEPKLAGN